MIQNLITTHAVFLFSPKEEILLIKRSSQDDTHPGLWELPRGEVQPGTPAFLNLKRKTLLDTGLIVQ